MGNDQFQRFDATVRKVLSVSRDELKVREQRWKANKAARSAAKVKAEMEADKQLRAEARSRKITKEDHAKNARAAFEKAAKAFKDNPKLQVPY
jgi:hypothetical protein